MVTRPQVSARTEQPYASVRTQVAMSELGSGIIPQLHSEVLGWLRQQGVAATGEPFIRYNFINMSDKLDIELGWPTAQVLEGSDRINTGRLPAGDYASILYTGAYDGLIDANRVLIEWARESGITWDGATSDRGETFACRIERYIMDPGNEPDPAKWETEVAIKVADKARVH